MRPEGQSSTKRNEEKGATSAPREPRPSTPRRTREAWRSDSDGWVHETSGDSGGTDKEEPDRYESAPEGYGGRGGSTTGRPVPKSLLDAKTEERKAHRSRGRGILSGVGGAR